MGRLWVQLTMLTAGPGCVLEALLLCCIAICLGTVCSCFMRSPFACKLGSSLPMHLAHYVFLQVRKYLVEDRRPAPDAMRQGFCSLDIADDLENLSGLELATLFFGEQYVDVDRLVAAIQAEGAAGAEHVQDWLERFIRSLSENSVRAFLARTTNKLMLPQHANHTGGNLCF